MIIFKWYLTSAFLSRNFRESQKHRMAEAGRDLWVPLGQPLLQQCHPEQGAQAHGQATSGDPQGGDPTASGQSVPLLHHTHSTKVLPHVLRKHSVDRFVPFASHPLTGHHWKKPGCVLFAPSLQVFIGIDEIHFEIPFLQDEQSRLSQPLLIGKMLQALHHLCGPVLDSFQYVLVSCSGGPRTALQGQPHQCWEEESPSPTCWQSFTCR